MKTALFICSLLLALCSPLSAGSFFRLQQGVVASQGVVPPEPIEWGPPTANLVYWLSARQETAFSDGDSVETPTDWSGAGNAPTQATSSRRPTYETNVVNGLPVFRFDGVDDRFDFSGAALDMAKNQSGLTVYVVVIPATTTGGQRNMVSISSGISTTQQRALVALAASGTTLVGGRRLDTDGFANPTGSLTHTGGTAWVVTTVFDWANSDLLTWRNTTGDLNYTTFQTNGSTSNTSSLAATIGSNSAGSFIFTGDIAEILIYQESHDSTERADIQSGLMTIYGL
ncbi:MAG: hypothetical protein ACO25M_05055 [Limnohabitans sp.]